MEGDRFGFWQIGQLRGQARFVGLQRVHARLHRGMEHALRDGGDDVVDLLRDFAQIPFGVSACGDARKALFLHLPLKLGDELADQIGV
ncbi:hypothetical protein [Rhodobacter amnigenus]|uniref:hypothetical protein n=1 Tax=Paragemmobacter amnigenus TaxID=2852097 RepID=UPI001E41B9CA|nr:hypothetical protein [Rhodobacter amnigenus]